MVRRTNRELRTLILNSFQNQSLPIREIAKRAGIDWYSTERHLTYLKGRDMVKEVFTHKLLRLFEITELGNSIVEELKKKRQDKKIRRIINRSL